MSGIPPTADELSTPIRVLYAASSPADGEFVRAETAANSPLISITCATSAKEALTCLDAIGPFDAILVDPELPDGDPAPLISRIRMKNPGVGIVACVMTDDDAAAAPVLEAGAHAWIPRRRDTIAQLYPVFRRAIDSSRQSAQRGANSDTNVGADEVPGTETQAISRGFDAAMAIREATLAHESERARLEEALAAQRAEAARLAVELDAVRRAQSVERQELEAAVRATRTAADAERETMRKVLGEREEARAGLARDLMALEQQFDTVLRELETARLAAQLVEPAADTPQRAPDGDPRDDERERLDARAEAGRLIVAVCDDFDALVAALDRECRGLRQALADGPEQADTAGLDRELQAARALTRMLRAFSRRAIQRTRAVDVNMVLENLRPMLTRVSGDDVLVDLDLQPVAGTETFDPVELEFVLMTVVLAIRRQMPTGGRVSIAARPAAGAADGDRGIQLTVTARRWRHDIAIPELASDQWLAPASGEALTLDYLQQALKDNGGWIGTSATSCDHVAITIRLGSA